MADFVAGSKGTVTGSDFVGYFAKSSLKLISFLVVLCKIWQNERIFR